LDNFISPIPSFEGDILISAIPISAQTLSGESTDDSSAGPSAESSKTRANKRKDTTAPPPLKKFKKIMGKLTGGININQPANKPSSTPTPSQSPWEKF
jgi:hypothetical protein